MCHGWLVHFAANNRFLVRYHGTMSPKQYIKHYKQQKRTLKNFSLKTTIAVRFNLLGLWLFVAPFCIRCVISTFFSCFEQFFLNVSLNLAAVTHLL